MNKRDLVLSLLDKSDTSDYIPAGFFLHFNPEYHHGRPAVDKHLEFFKYTEMDFVKIQYEHRFPVLPELVDPEDWNKLKVLGEDYFSEPLAVVKGLVDAVKNDSIVIVTLYSPFMIAGQVNGQDTITRHILENPSKAKLGMEVVTQSMLNFIRGCVRLGVDGFYSSTQGAEIDRFPSLEPFNECIKPYDMMVMNEINHHCEFNILHICDYHAGYRNIQPFLGYPGQVVNSSLVFADGNMTSRQVSKLFGRPFMGGLERKGIIATGTTKEIEDEVEKILEDAPAKFILAADCTVPGETKWENLRTAIRKAHEFRS